MASNTTINCKSCAFRREGFGDILPVKFAGRECALDITSVPTPKIGRVVIITQVQGYGDVVE